MTDSERKRLEEILPVGSSRGDAGRKDSMIQRGTGMDEISDMALIEELLIGSDLDFNAGPDLDWALPEFLLDDFDVLADALDSPDPLAPTTGEPSQRLGSNHARRQAPEAESAEDLRAALDEILSAPDPALLRGRKLDVDRSALDSILTPLPEPKDASTSGEIQAGLPPSISSAEEVQAEAAPALAPPAAARTGFLSGLMRRAGIRRDDGTAVAPPVSATTVPQIRRS